MASEKWAIVFNNTVSNICLWDGVVWSEENPTAWQPPADATMVNVQNIPCGIGWIYDGNAFARPEETP